jgi:two-component system, response regulator, stage 0 sporulation protein F
MKTILVVDDDKSLRRLYKSELEAEGYGIMLAADGSQAMDLVNRGMPDLVVMDIRMPGMDGLETMGRLLHEHGGVPVILHTAYSCYQDDFLAWAADGYVIKSADLEPLKEKIRDVLSQPPTSSPCARL